MISLNQLEENAINHAVEAEWEKAIEVNNQILSIEPDNLSAYLRIGYANLQLNNLEEAKNSFEMVLKLQPKNIIAVDHLEKIKLLLSRKKKRAIGQTKFNPDIFIETPGKTKTVSLVNLGQKEDLAGINIGQGVVIREKRRRLEIRSEQDDYVGSLPDDISKRLSYFINEGSKYDVHIKEITLTSVVVFIREISKGKKVRQYPSFPTNPHTMLSDINQIDEEDPNNPKSNTDDDEEGNEDSDGEEINTSLLGVDVDDDEEWEDLEEEKDLGSIVQIEDQDEEEDE